jgi:hypothetical protein
MLLDSKSPTVMPVATGRRPTTKTLGMNADDVLVVTQGFEKQWKWGITFRDVPDIQSLFEVLEKDSQNPNAAVLRGALRDHVDPGGVIHLRKDVNKWGDTAHFEERPRRWLMIDIDKQPLDDIDLVNDPVGTVKRAIEKFLPECYQGVSFVWQLSSSAGIGEDTGSLSIHIWFILDRAVGQDELKIFHELKAPAIDRRPFQTVQIHYIATPIFEDGIQDHLSKRIGLVNQDKAEVSLPQLPSEAISKAFRTIGKGPTGSVHGFEEKLKFLGDGEGLSRFHDVLIAAASSFVYGKYKCEIDVEWLKERLREAIKKAPKQEGRINIPHYLSDGYLDQNIDTAMSKFCQEVTHPEYLAPTMTAKQARDKIKLSLWETVDQYFEELANWEKINKPYQDAYQKKFVEYEASAEHLAEIKGVEYDPVAEGKEIRKLVFSDLLFTDLEHPGQPPQLVLSLAVGVGLGKTEQAFQLIKYVQDKASLCLRADDALKLSDATRIALQRLTRAVLAVPTHKLADEAVCRARSTGLSAGPFRGRLYEIKETGEHPMCNRADSVKRCIEAGLPVASSMCKNELSECKFRWTCEYYAQMDFLYDCEVVVFSHASLFHEKPTINSRGLLIIDEQFAFDGVRERQKLLVSQFSRNEDKVYLKDDAGDIEVSDDLTAKLHRYRETAANILETSPNGNLSPRSLSSLRIEEIAEAIRLEWQTGVSSPVYPGMSRNMLLKALAAVVAIKQLRLRISFWEALLALTNSDRKRSSGWLIRDVDDEGHTVVHVGGRATIKAGWFDGLAVCLDATASSELVELYFPKQKIITPPAIEAVQPNVTVLQTIDRAFAASMCIPTDGLEPDELQRRRNRAKEIWRFILLRAAEFRGRGADGIDVLVICQQALEAHLVELGLPENVDIAHFNATRGIDKWGSVACLVEIGRTIPPPSEVEKLAENLTGWDVKKVDAGQWYPRKSAGVDVGDGVGLSVQAERHPDPISEVVRWQICEAELVQVIGRGRGVNRSVDKPLHVDVLNNVCLPLTIDQPIRWDDNAPGRIEEMVGMGLLPDGPAAAALVYPDLWPTVKTAKKAAENARAKAPKANILEETTEPLNGPNPLLYISNRELGPFSAKRTHLHLSSSFESLVKTWSVKPLAVGVLSNMQMAQARVERINKRALKFEFLFNPDLISEPELWIAERTGCQVEIEYTSFVSNPTPELLDQHCLAELKRSRKINKDEFCAAVPY